MATGFKNFFGGITLVPKSVSTVSAGGDMEFLSSTSKANLHNGVTSSPVVTEAHTATLTNKTINGNNNTLLNIPDSALPADVVYTNDVQSLTNKTLGSTNTVTLLDTQFTLQDNASPSKQANFDLSAISASTTRVVSIPDADITVVGTNNTQTLSNKTLDNSTVYAAKDTSFILEDADDSDVKARFDLNGLDFGVTTVFNLPVGDTTLVGTDSTQTLSNKTINGSANTVTNINLANQASGAATNGQVATANGSGGVTFTTPSNIPKNWAQNPGFDIWQRQTSNTTTNNGRNYICDRWYTNNLLGTNGVITTSRQTGNVNGSKYALRQIISASPTALQTNGCELYQVLENQDSLNFYNQTASFSIYVRGQGNVNQVGVQFYSATTETAVNSPIGSEVTATVSNSTDTVVKIDGQAIGTAMGLNGVIGVRIRITGVSSGNTYDLNNGFQVEQAMLNLGALAGTFNKPNMQEITSTCLRFYEKSYAPGTFAGTTTVVGCEAIVRGDGSNALNVRYQVPKRSVGSPVAWSTQTGSNNAVYDPAGGTDRAANLNNGSVNGFQADPSSATIGRTYLFQWTADSEI